MSNSDGWSGRAVTKARAIVAQWLPAPCGQCGETVDGSVPWVVGHKVARSIRPDLMFVLSNWQPEHRSCSNRSAQGVVIAKAKAEALAEHGITPKGSVLPSGTGQTVPAPPGFSLPGGTTDDPLTIREGLWWSPKRLAEFEWLKGSLDVPEDASPPLAMTPPHADAVGSYGPQAIEWAKAELGITLRWWQALCLIRMLEHREDGSLCWRFVIKSAPRRAGKSWLMRVAALWRMKHADLIGEEQTVLHTAQDMKIVRDILRRAWLWGEKQEPAWKSSKSNGKEALESPAGDRWLALSNDGVFGYDCGFGIVDEAWAVKPEVVDDGLEPASLERLWPQLLLTSTAHRRATSLMRGRISAALADDDGRTLLLLWAAPFGSEPGDRDAWRAASPHWSADRADLIASRYERALAGEADPEFDDPDPIRGFASQYLNLWDLTERKVEKGKALVSEADWDALKTKAPNRAPDAAAVEQDFGGAVSVAFAWADADKVATVHVVEVPDLATAAATIRSFDFRKTVAAGASLVDDPAFKRMRTKEKRERVNVAAADLSRMLKDGVIRHDGTDPLRSQVLALRTLPGVDGERVVSRERADALKASMWAATDARTAKSSGSLQILLPTI